MIEYPFVPKLGGTQTISATQANSQKTLSRDCRQVLVTSDKDSANMAFFRFASAAATASSTTDTPIAPGAAQVFTKYEYEHFAVICKTGETATLYITEGNGP